VADGRWLTPGVRGIGAASLLADLGHEIPTAGDRVGGYASTAVLTRRRSPRPPLRWRSPPSRCSSPLSSWQRRRRRGRHSGGF
jgi:hypothetical protein